MCISAFMGLQLPLLWQVQPLLLCSTLIFPKPDCHAAPGLHILVRACPKQSVWRSKKTQLVEFTLPGRLRECRRGRVESRTMYSKWTETEDSGLEKHIQSSFLFPFTVCGCFFFFLVREKSSLEPGLETPFFPFFSILFFFTERFFGLYVCIFEYIVWMKLNRLKCTVDSEPGTQSCNVNVNCAF